MNPFPMFSTDSNRDNHLEINMKSFSAIQQPRPYRTYVILLLAVILGNFLAVVVYRYDFQHPLLSLAMTPSIQRTPKFRAVRRTNLSFADLITTTLPRTSVRPSVTGKVESATEKLRTSPSSIGELLTRSIATKAKQNSKYAIVSTSITKILDLKTTQHSILRNETSLSPLELAAVKLWYGSQSFKVPAIPSYPGLISAPGSFKVSITPEEKRRMMELLRTFHKLMRKHNITYMLYGGTLIGAYRHHGMVPWDDDIDVWVNFKQRDLLLEALKTAGKEYNYWSTSGSFQWKFYLASSTPIRHKEWRWPFIDIFFYVTNATHIWDHNPGCCRSMLSLKKDVFPLRQIPYEGWTFPGPCNAEHIVTNAIGDLKVCQSTWYDHKRELSRTKYPLQSINCSKLFPYFPFVFRSPRGNLVKESLMIGYKPVNTILRPKYCNSES
ncbi:uncharacterized protein LOC135502251 [Lineus longissimus]|uniref:uncharacterized protein LOC135502251 n=1 Tax=Lineus longissimus TaxID=88925 RepID=UPI00315D6B17